MHKCTRLLVLPLGLLSGIMGIEHGIGEIFQGTMPTNGTMILSWPDSAFFKVMSGEPAMTLFPNYLLAGIASILLSLFSLVLILKFIDSRKGIIVLLVVEVLMLLAGAGFGPPLLGIIVGLIAFKLRTPLKVWRRLPTKLHHVLGLLWPWVYGLCLAGWIMLFPGAGLIAHLTGADDALLMIVPIVVAFGLILPAMLLGFSRDIQMERGVQSGG